MANLVSMRAAQIADEAAAFDADPANSSRLFIPSSVNSLPSDHNMDIAYKTIEDAFPDVDPRVEPFGDLILVMIRVPQFYYAPGLEIGAETRKTELDNTQVAKVIKVGPMAFKWQRDGSPWPEGPWCQAGDFIRIPKYQGDRFVRTYTRKGVESTPNGPREVDVTDRVHFAQFKHTALLGKYPDAAAALAERAYL